MPTGRPSSLATYCFYPPMSRHLKCRQVECHENIYLKKEFPEYNDTTTQVECYRNIYFKK